MKISQINICISSSWEQVPVTQSNLGKFLAWFIASNSGPYKKAAKSLKAYHAKPDPKLKMFSGAEAEMSIDVGTKELFVSPSCQWGDNTLDEVQSPGFLRHELGHLIYQRIKELPEALAFQEAIQKEVVAQKKNISRYHGIVANRFLKKQVNFNVLCHETFAEICKFDAVQDRGCPLVFATFKKLWKKA